jgi:outer membrane protein
MTSMRHAPALTAGAIAAALACATPARADVFSFDHTLDNILGRAMELMPLQGVKNVRLGLGPSYDPRFLGDKGGSVGLAPVVSLRYRNLIAVDNNSVRVNFLGNWGKDATSPWSAGPAVKIDFGRGEDDSPKLRGLGDIGTSLELGGFVGYRMGSTQFRVRARRDVVGATSGVLIDGEVNAAVVETDRLFGRVGAQIVWTDSKYTNAYFGVTPGQSVASGLPIYQAKSGLYDASLTISLEYLVTDRWSALAILGYTRLLGSAADSPLVRLRGSANQGSFAAFAIYAF